MNPQFWLATVDVHGNVKALKDGSHSTREEVEHALYTYERLGFINPNETYVCVELYVTSVVSKAAEDHDEEALDLLKLYLEEGLKQ